jgi:hypothetical protein
MLIGFLIWIIKKEGIVPLYFLYEIKEFFLVVKFHFF